MRLRSSEERVIGTRSSHVARPGRAASSDVPPNVFFDKNVSFAGRSELSRSTPESFHRTRIP